VPQNFQAALAQWPEARVVHLDSPGGHIQPALQVARIIRDWHLDTYVVRGCASACTLAFLAGQRRWLAPQGKLGFHQAHAPGASDGDEVGLAMLRQAYSTFGVPEPFIAHVLRTPPRELWVPTVGELQASRIVTDLAPEGMFALSGFGPQPDLAASERSLLAVPLLAALAPADAHWPVLVNTWQRAMALGLPDTEFVGAVRLHLRAALAKLLPLAPDAAVRDYAAVTERALASLGAESCWRMLRHGTAEGPAELPGDIQAARTAALTRVLTEATRAPVLADAGARRAAYAAIAGQLRDSRQDADLVLAALHGEVTDHAAYCTAARASLHAALALPPPSDAVALRALLGDLDGPVQ
jgi:hypothetical protein